MGYLDQLKNISKVPDGVPKEPKKPPERGCLGSLGALPGAFEKIHVSDCRVEAANEKPCKASRWLLHFGDRNPLQAAFSPAVIHAEVLASYPDALAAEPAAEIRRQADTMLASDQEAAILAWLAQIGETNEAIVGDVLAQCRHDEDAGQYFLGRAGESATSGMDNRRPCDQCGHLRSGVCVVAKPGGVVSAIRGYRPARSVPQRCVAFVPTHQPANSLSTGT